MVSLKSKARKMGVEKDLFDTVDTVTDWANSASSANKNLLATRLGQVTHL